MRMGLHGVQGARGQGCTMLSDRILIGRPAASLGQAQFVKVFESIDAGIMPVAEAWADRVMAHRAKRRDGHIFLVELKNRLPRTMALYFGGWRKNPKVFKRQDEDRMIVIGHLKGSGGLMKDNAGGCGAVHVLLSRGYNG